MLVLVLNRRRRAEDFLNISSMLLPSPLGSCIRQLHADEDLALVFIRQEAGWKESAIRKSGKPAGRKHHQRQDAFPDHRTGKPQIDFRAASETYDLNHAKNCEWARGFPSLAEE